MEHLRGEREGNGRIERFFRTLKEQLLWIRHFRSVEELAPHWRNSECSRTITHLLIQRLGFSPRFRPDIVLPSNRRLDYGVVNLSRKSGAVQE